MKRGCRIEHTRLSKPATESGPNVALTGSKRDSPWDGTCHWTMTHNETCKLKKFRGEPGVEVFLRIRFIGRNATIANMFLWRAEQICVPSTLQHVIFLSSVCNPQRKSMKHAALVARIASVSEFSARSCAWETFCTTYLLNQKTFEQEAAVTHCSYTLFTPCFLYRCLCTLTNFYTRNLPQKTFTPKTFEYFWFSMNFDALNVWTKNLYTRNLSH